MFQAVLRGAVIFGAKSKGSTRGYAQTRKSWSRPEPVRSLQPDYPRQRAGEPKDLW